MHLTRRGFLRKPSNNTNGNTRDRQGRLVSCEHDTRRVTRTEYDGTITVLLDNERLKISWRISEGFLRQAAAGWTSQCVFLGEQREMVRELRGVKYWRIVASAGIKKP